MISGEVDKFYRKVIKDLIANLGKNESVLLELQQNNIYLNQIEQKMTQKINQSSSLFKRLINSYNEIEKEMNSRFATLSSDPSYAPQHHHMMNEESLSLRQSDQIHYSFSNDISLASNSLSNHKGDKKERVQQEKVEKEQLPFESEEKPSKKRAASQYSLEDLSDIEQGNDDAFKRLRQNVKIHILGTYDLHSKKHDFKMDKTDVILQNVFVKAEGMNRQFFLKTLHCTSRKKVHE